MAQPTEAEIFSIELAFQTLEVIAGHMSDETLAELHTVRARIFGHLRDLELRWLDRLLARKGPLTQIPPDDVCSYADSALTAWTQRKG